MFMRDEMGHGWINEIYVRICLYSNLELAEKASHPIFNSTMTQFLTHIYVSPMNSVTGFFTKHIE